MELEIIERSLSDGVNPTVIKIVGVGGGGNNAVDRMISDGIRDVEFISINTDVQDLQASKASKKIAIGESLTKGLGAGGDPKKGEKAAMETEEKIEECLRGADMVFITCGLGGGTGTGASPIIAKIAKENVGALTVAVVTTPFDYEGLLRKKRAEEGLAKLKQEVDSIIVIPNQNLMDYSRDKNLSTREAFKFADIILTSGVKGISQIITNSGTVSVDFADVKTIMADGGDAVIGMGSASGENRVAEATTKAMQNPLLNDIDFEGASGLLVNVVAKSLDDLSLVEQGEISSIVNAGVLEGANQISGLFEDPDMEEELSVTVIATGFSKNQKKEEVINDEIQEDILFDDESSAILSNDRFKEFEADELASFGSSNLEIPTFFRKN